MFSFNQIYISHWTYINKIFESYIAETHSFDLETHSFCFLGLTNTNESVGKPCLINLFLNFLTIRNKFNAFGLFKEMMKELSFEHEIVIIYFLQLPDQIFFTNNQSDHLLSYSLSDLFYCTLKLHFTIALS